MQCLESQEYLQRRLDGEAPALAPDLEEHLAQCSSCRALHAAGQALLGGLKALPASAPPSMLSGRMAGLVLEDSRIRRRRVRLGLLVSASLAACLLIMALAGYWRQPGDAPPVDPLVKGKRENADALPPRLAKSVDDARQAVASLSDRIADGAKEQTKVLLAAANPMSGLDSFPDVPPALGLEPAAQSLQQAGHGVADGLEPMATGTRRAFSFFVRELSGLDAKH